MIKQIKLPDISKELSNIIRSDVFTRLSEPGLPYSVMYSDYLSVEIPDYGLSFYEGVSTNISTTEIDRSDSNGLLVIIRDLGSGRSCYEAHPCEDIGEGISRFIQAYDPEYYKHKIYLKAGELNE